MHRRATKIEVPATSAYATVSFRWGPVVLRRLTGSRGQRAIVMAQTIAEEAIRYFAEQVPDLRRIQALLDEVATPEREAEIEAEVLEIQSRRDKMRELDMMEAHEDATGWLLMHAWADPDWEIATPYRYAERQFSDADDPPRAAGRAMVEELLEAGWTSGDLSLAWAVILRMAGSGEEPIALGPDSLERAISFFGRPKEATP